MVNWRKESFTGSIKRWARREVRKHLRNNPTARRVHYRTSHRASFVDSSVSGLFLGSSPYML